MTMTLREAAEVAILDLETFQSLNPTLKSTGLIHLREALAQPEQPAANGFLTVVGFRSDGDGGPILTATSDIRLHEGDRLYTAPPAPVVPDGWGLAAFQHKWEACDTQCECKVCGTVFGAVPGPAVPPVSDDWKAHFSSVFWLLENDRSQWLVNDSGEFTDDVHKAWKFTDEATAHRARAALPPSLSMTKPTEHMVVDAGRSERCHHARTFNGRLCCDCGAEVDPATQNFGRYGKAAEALVWHPIETAPKDGRCAVVLDCVHQWADVAYWNGSKWTAERFRPLDYSPTHWLELPGLPKVSDKMMGAMLAAAPEHPNG